MSSALSGDLDVEKDPAYNKLKTKHDASEKAKKVLRGAGYARGGGVSPVKKKAMKVSGEKPKGRADKYARGGSVPKGHHTTKINLNLGASSADKQEAMKKGVQIGAQLAAAKMAGAGGAPRPMGGAPMQARGPMPPPPGAAPGGMPPGGPGGVPPTMQARGGRTYKRGGKVAGVKHLTGGAGAGGGEGRLAKIKSYGAKPKQ